MGIFSRNQGMVVQLEFATKRDLNTIKAVFGSKPSEKHFKYRIVFIREFVLLQTQTSKMPFLTR